MARIVSFLLVIILSYLVWTVKGHVAYFVGDTRFLAQKQLVLLQSAKVNVTLLTYYLFGSTQPATLSGEEKWVIAYGFVWLIGAVAVVCLHAASRVQLLLASTAMDGRIVRCDIISSYQLLVSCHFQDYKALLWASPTSVSIAVASTVVVRFLYLLGCKR